MITYFDSSSIIKWFFDEPSSDLARQVRQGSVVCVTSSIAYPEIFSAINRAWKDNRCSELEMEFVRKEFLRVWSDFALMPVHQTILNQTEQQIFTYNLRSFDAIHLVSAKLLRSKADVSTFFSCFDRRLNRAAKKEGFDVHQIE